MSVLQLDKKVDDARRQGGKSAVLVKPPSAKPLAGPVVKGANCPSGDKPTASAERYSRNPIWSTAKTGRQLYYKIDDARRQGGESAVLVKPPSAKPMAVQHRRLPVSRGTVQPSDEITLTQDGDAVNVAPGNVLTDLKQGGRAKTDTAAFKQWFGDSKVVDDQGKGTNPSISPDIASAIGRESAPILLRDGDKKSGLAHIEERHGDQARTLGYANAREMVDDIARNFDAIYAGRGRALILAKRTPIRGQAYVQLEPSEDGAAYDVKSAAPSRNDQFKNSKPLWERTGTSASLAETGAVPPSAQSGDEIISDREKTNNQNHPGHGIRGSYQRSRDPYGDISNWINFTKDADRSTFIHESGHFWLFQLIIDAFGLRDRINL